MMNTSLSDVPEELMIKILSHLDALSLACCSKTCKAIYETIRNSSLLTYTIELHLNGLRDTVLSAPYANLLEDLLRHRQAWLSLELGEPVTLQLPYSGYGIELIGTAFAYTNSERITQIISLPTSSNIEKYTPQNEMTGLSVIAFTMDPTQDMIAMLCDDANQPSPTDPRINCIHIRTMSTDISHPLAHDSCLSITLYPHPPHNNRVGQPLLHIAHNILVFTFLDPSQERRLMIWDWTTSDLILDSSVALDPVLPRSGYQYGYRFGLIDHTYCLFISPVDAGSIRLYTFIRASGVTTPLIHLATLHLPPVATGVSVTGISAQAGPILAQTTAPVRLAVDDAARLHLFTLVYRRGPEHGISTNLFVHQRVFMEYIAGSADRGGAGPPLDVPWLEWGPRNTRILCPSYRTTARWQNRCVHGQRVVQFPRKITRHDPAGPPSVEVLDFSRAAVLAAQDTVPRPLSSPMSPPGVLAPSSILQHPYFLGDVETHLPYVCWTRELPRQYHNFLINEACMIGFQSRYGLGDLFVDIYTVS